MHTSVNQKVLEKVSKRIAPSWPLKNFVAVNPYAGFTDTPYADTARILGSRAGIGMTMPLAFYLGQVKDGVIQRKDIQKALETARMGNTSVDTILGKAQKIQKGQPQSGSDYNLLDVASRIELKDWNELLIDRVSFWAAAHFDRDVSVWKTKSSGKNLYQAWKLEAQIDRTTEIMGLPGFRSAIKQLPNNPLEFIDAFLSQLGLDEEETEAYLHALLLKVLGWSSYISGLDFHNSLYDGNKSNLTEFLAVLLTWENYFLNHSPQKQEIKAIWYQKWNTGEPLSSQNESLKLALLFQDALDFASQRELKSVFQKQKPLDSKAEAKAQMVFCIDVRSEVYRRNLERVNPQIETVGFAGFFGFPVNYVPLGHEDGKNQCPVLIPSSALVKEACTDQKHAAKKRISDHQIGKTWKKFKSGAITSFGFVSPIGLSFLPKILLNSFHITRPNKDPKQDGIGKWQKKGKMLDLSAISLADKVAMAASSLTGMGIKDNLAPFVLITGHGSSSVNNPHASGLDCGACGGHSGEVNALTAQYVFNDPEVRNKLKEQGINIPEETIFLACLHDTTTDEISFVNDSWVPESRQKELADLKQSLQLASKHTRLERTLRLNIEGKSDEEIENRVKARAEDWAQIRPEWGLAGCNSFIVAPRDRSKGLKLDGKSFLHNYNWKEDPEFKVLEIIMTAPMVVTSWINLQYYASTTDNQRLGAGNKTLHNITSGLGVLEGSSGDLRIGLPLQSVHNGEKFEHLPIRLNVVIEAPIEAINSILEKHDHLRQLFDNEWIYLHCMDEQGKISHTYHKNLQWKAEEKVAAQVVESVL
ncbi:DUF2309 domain-containing protein [Algoriphagus kandeliae]|uniref:Probable inorganic carbon transporter subunit DabA n=1 Tax=Algoriphagus kandeliae TaxID=2562278 RepID=A0A4Y9QT26_9BACT|nr:DUF2309 domain-containing protein [Algoriphagus kandeliae]TFV95661.1 DUF2309 domain-containing protein [Algoriphagus kandeliae]